MDSILGQEVFWIFIALLCVVGLVFWRGRVWLAGLLYGRIERLSSEIESGERILRESYQSLEREKKGYRMAESRALAIIEEAHAEAGRIKEQELRLFQERLRRKEKLFAERIEREEERLALEVKDMIILGACELAEIIMERRLDEEGDKYFERSLNYILESKEVH